MNGISNVMSLYILSALLLVTGITLSFGILNAYGQTSADTVQSLPSTVKTDNESTEIHINANNDLVSSTPTSFFIEFRHPFSSMPLQHVNYNLEVLDSSGKPVFSEQNQHTHIGQNEHEITFNSTGNYDIKINVLGTGIDPPFDTTRSGIATVPVTVN
jgi:hypothetical protein